MTDRAPPDGCPICGEQYEGSLEDHLYSHTKPTLIDELLTYYDASQ